MTARKTLALNPEAATAQPPALKKKSRGLPNVGRVLALALAGGVVAVPAAASDPMLLSLEVPKPFRGVWAEDGSSCKKRDAAKHARIGKTIFEHRQSRFEIAGVRNASEGSIIADAYLVKDGTRSRTDITMQMVDPFAMLANIGGVPMVFIRCSAVEPTWGDVIGGAVDRM